MSKNRNTNISDHSEVEKRNNEIKRLQLQDRKDLLTIMKMPEGQRFLINLLNNCYFNQSVWHSSSIIHKNAGMQEVGQMVYREMVLADTDLAAKLVANELKRQLGNQGE